MTTSQKPLNVLHIGKFFPPYAGGMETFLRDIMAALRRLGCGQTALVHQSRPLTGSTTERVTVGDAELEVVRVSVWFRLLFTPISPLFPLWLNRLLKARAPDVLHLHTPNVSAFWALLLPRARRIPWVIQWQSDVVASEHSLGLRLFYGLYRPFEHMLLKRCDCIIVSSPGYLESSAPLQPFRNKCRIIPLGIDPMQFTEAGGVTSPPADAAGDLVVLAVGRLTYYKGFEYLLRAAAEVEGVRVQLVGSGDLEARLKALAKSLGLDRRVDFLGSVSTTGLHRLMRACDCVCLPSIERTESFGLVLLEAMYFAKATLASDVPGSGMGWIVDDGDTGLTFPPRDSDKIAGALRQLQADRAMVARLGENGRRKFDRDFHIDRAASRILETYRELTET